ncbi:hypothetical protein PtB15_7B354 [Puccinia triticina]|nr:hypothetical protein PtB15_7B354 [Puccinia triticina]
MPEGYAPTSSGPVSARPASEYLSTMIRLREVATRTRPDMLYGVATLARFSQKPTAENWRGLAHMIGYLARTRKTALRLVPNGTASAALEGYSDAVWAGTSVPSIGGTIVRVYGCPVYAGSQRLPDYALSAFDAEMMAVDETIKQALWIRDLLKSLLGASLTIRLNCDSNPVGTHVHAGATIPLRISDHPTIRAGLAVLAWIPPADQLANILTEPLPKTSFDLLAPKVQGRSVAP